MKAVSIVELIAEMGAALLCAVACIANDYTSRNTIVYIQNWIAKLEADNRLIIHAARNAQRAADCILGNTLEDMTKTTEEMRCRLQRHPQ